MSLKNYVNSPEITNFLEGYEFPKRFEFVEPSEEEGQGKNGDLILELESELPTLKEILKTL